MTEPVSRRNRLGPWFVVVAKNLEGKDVFWLGLLQDIGPEEKMVPAHLFSQSTALAAQFDTAEQAQFNAQMLGLTVGYRIARFRWSEIA